MANPMRSDAVEPFETTVLSLSNDVPTEDAANRRTGERHMTLFRVGSFDMDGRRELCLIKNISAGGMMIRSYCDLQPGRRLTVELKCGQPVSGTVSWAKEPYAGVAFDQPVDVIDILSASQSGPRPRMPRVEADCPATLREGATPHRVWVSDISQGGAKIRCKLVLAAGTPVVLTVPGLAPIAGVACWSDGENVGVSFNRLLPLAEMVHWLKVQRGERQSLN